MAELDFEQLVGALSDVVAVFDRDHRYVYVNEAVERTTGVLPASLLGERADYLMTPEDAVMWRAALDHVHATGDAREIERTVDTPRGRRRFNSMLTRITGDRVCVISRDVTNVPEIKQLEVAIERARLADRRKDEFLAMLSHELRNPLAPIATALELMELKGNGDVGKEHDVIRRQVGHLSRLIDDLLDMSRITRGKIQLDREPIEIGAVLAKAIEMASPLLEKRMQRLAIDVPRSGAVVDADPTRLAQVFQNLVTNAAKYSGDRTLIELHAHAEPDHIVVELRDQGVGISAELLPRLFELFAQGDRTLDRSEGGLGIGLTIAKSLCELHGGTIVAASAGPGQGSTFIVTLPRVTGVRAADTSRAVLAKLAPALGAATRVLVVDDNIDAAQMLRDFLLELGHEPAVAYDGPAALELASSFKPDIAVLDIGLPVMNGYELARRLRETLGPDKLRLIAVTGYGQDSDREHAFEVGFDHHLIKPIELGALLPLLTK